MDISITLILFITLFTFIALGLPIVFSIGISVMIVSVYIGFDPTFIVQKMSAIFAHFSLNAILLFVLMGTILSQGGATRVIVDAIESLVGNIRGGLGIVTVWACAAFGTVTGSAIATAAAIGSVMLPEMRRRGYEPSFAAAIVAAGSPLGQMIPPSITAIIYGVIVHVSIGKLFLALVVPGIFLAIILSIGIYIMARRKGLSGAARKFTGKEKLRLCLRASPGLSIPVVVVYGIYGGVFTPTEAGAVCVVIAVLLIGTVYRDREKPFFTCLKEGLYQGAMITSVVMVIIAVSTAWAYFLSVQQIPRTVAFALVSFSRNPIVILLLLNLLMIILGTFMEGGAITIMIAPVLVLVLPELGISFVHFGVLLVLNLMIGNLTPPVGVVLYVTAGLAKDLKFGAICKALIPFILIEIGVLLVITLFPQMIPGL